MTVEQTWLKVRIPIEIQDLLRKVAAERKASGEKPDSIQGMVSLSITRFLSGDADSERLQMAFELLRQASVDFRHFGLRDFGSRLIQEAVKLGADSDLSRLEGTGGEETRRS